MNGLIYLEPEDVLEIHDAYIDMFGGIKGIRDEGLFSQLCEAPYHEFDNVELFPKYLIRLPSISLTTRFPLTTSCSPSKSTL